jgi:hypothetical protein
MNMMKTSSLVSQLDQTQLLTVKLLSNLDISKQGGDDGLTNRMLRIAATSLGQPLSKLLNKSLMNGVFPCV